MGGKQDELDVLRARRFAWRLVRPTELESASGDEPVDAAAEPPKAPPVRRPPSRRLPASARLGTELGPEIERAWSEPRANAQADASARLARKAARLGHELRALPGPQSVRLARLFVRHHARFTPASRKAAVEACLFLPLNDPQTTDLLVELAESGNESLGAPLGYNLEQDHDTGLVLPNGRSLTPEADHDGSYAWYRDDLAPRLALIIEAGRSFACCKLALDWLGPEPAVIPVLKRALRYPHLGVRVRALETLLLFKRVPLAADDVLFLLHDLIESDVLADADDEDDETRYATALCGAVSQVRPEGGAEWLAAHAWESSDLELESSEFGEAWALSTLAAAYPDESLWLIDRKLRSARAWDRRSAVEALVHLPEAEARPRLLLGAVDGAPDVSDRARELWLQVTSEMCPAEPSAGLMIELLDGPPSERLLGRLLVLRHEPGRAAMLEALLREAPDAEALTLLIFALADNLLSCSYRRRGLPSDGASWAKRLIKLFGLRAIVGLASLAERYPYGETSSHFHLLYQLVKEGVIKKKHAAPLRAAAARHLVSGLWDGEGEPLALLKEVGAPAELLDTLWSIAAEQDGAETGAHIATEMLEGWGDRAALEAKAAFEMERALEARDPGLLYDAARVARRCRAKSMLPLAARALLEFDSSDAVSALGICASVLQDAGQLSDAWIEDKLDQPSSYHFTVATTLCKKKLSPPIRTALLRALGSTARDGSAAAEAACALIFADRPPPLAQMDAVLARAPLAARAKLLCCGAVRRGWVARHANYLAELLTSADPEVAHAMCAWGFLWTRSRRGRDVVRRALPRVVNPELRETLEEDLG
jgi:hypothetical protein